VTVYVLGGCDEEETRLFGVFSSQENTEANILSRPDNGDFVGYSVRPAELDSERRETGTWYHHFSGAWHAATGDKDKPWRRL
jgi:hypothetical protein